MTLFPASRRWVVSTLPLACACITLTAAAKPDLDRLTPVAADQQIPIEDFFRPGLWQQPQMNPSGTHVAALVHAEGDRLHLVIHELDTQKTQVLGDDGSKDIYSFRWLNDRRIAFFVSTRKLYGLGMFGVDIDDLRNPFPMLQYCGATLVSIPRQNRLRPLVWLRREVLENDRDGGVAVVNTDVKTGKFVDLMSANASPNAANDAREGNRRRIVSTYPTPNTGITYHYMGDREGNLAFAFTSTDGVLAMHRLDSSRRWVACPVDLEHTDIVGPGDRPGEVLAALREADDKPSGVYFLNAETGERTDTLLADPDYDFDGYVYREAGSRQIVGAIYHRDGPRSLWFDEGFKKVQKALDDIFPGLVVQIIGNSEQGSRFLVRTFSDRQPTAYHWVDLEKRTGSLLRNTRPWIDAARMRPMQIMKFKTRDGRQLDAYVTLPKGASKKAPVALVVLPHGGPWVRDTWGFDGEAQFLASRGYAVLQPNYRGSPGQTWKFPIEDQWEFRKMHDDVTDATRTLLATGVIDQDRVAIMGASFGAYLALSGVAHEPEHYRCAVTIAGVFDWATVLQEEKFDRFDNPTYARMLRKLGDPKTQTEKFNAISPLRHVSQVRVPVFVAHGSEDRTAAIAESKRLVDELEKYKIPHEKLFVRGEGHGMAYLKNDVELYTRIETFLARTMKARPSAEPSPSAPVAN